MNETVFNQNPTLHMKALIGSLVISRLSNKEADRLELIFARPFIKEILLQETFTWQDYLTVYECCI
jgi:hypothetical protein